MEEQSLTVNLILDDSGIDSEQLEDIVKPFLKGRIELVITDPGCMKILNRKYRHVNHPTDVLSFDLRSDPSDAPEGVIYVDGRLYPPMEELLERIYHGYLHLKGRHHDTDSDALEMSLLVSEMVKQTTGGEG